MNIAELQKRVADGFVAAIPDGDLTIYNYTNRCVYAQAWDEYTLAARGLVVRNTGEVVARPWPKFFNLNERPESSLAALPNEVPELAEKYDGSLVIVFWDAAQDRWRAITRGCWKNAQTDAANYWLSRHVDKLKPLKGYTLLFELIAPWNRIVIQYQSTDYVLLGLFDPYLGVDYTYRETALLAEELGFTPAAYWTKPISEVNLDDTSVKDKEGYVARFSNGLRVKMKFAQYRTLHKILTGLSVKGIWERLSSGTETDFENVPDEFLNWYVAQRADLLRRYGEIDSKAREVFMATGLLGERKAYAEAFKKHGPLASVLFSMLDGKDYSKTIWSQVKPSHNTFQTADE